jgi:hypothetical protein
MLGAPACVGVAADDPRVVRSTFSTVEHGISRCGRRCPSQISDGDCVVQVFSASTNYGREMPAKLITTRNKKL